MSKTAIDLDTNVNTPRRNTSGESYHLSFDNNKKFSLRTVFDQGIKGQLDGNPGVKDHDLSARPNDTETIVGIQKSTNGLPSCFSDDLRFVCQLQTRSHRQIIGPRQCTVVWLLLLLLMKIHGVFIQVLFVVCGLWWLRN